MKRVHTSRSTLIVLAMFALAPAVLPAIVGAQTPSPHAIDPATEKPDKALLDKLLAQETQYWNAWKARDWATVRRMMGDDGIWVDPLNVFSTEGFVKAVESGSLAFSIGPRAYLRKPLPGVAILVYDVKVGFGRSDQAPNADWPWLLSSVFVNRNGQWVGVSRSEVRGNRPPRAPAGQ